MKLLLSCVNTNLTLIGFDWDEGKIFWSCHKDKINATGICYAGNRLFTTANDTVTILGPTDKYHIDLPGGYKALAHGIHVVSDEAFGVVDTGNSAVRIFNGNGDEIETYKPLEAWGSIPHDTIHLNDFALTPFGVFASCFDYRPWRSSRKYNQERWEDWCNSGYGVILNLSGHKGKGIGRIVGCGFNHPHSLQYVNPFFYLCSSATGIFHVCNFTKSGELTEEMQFKISDDHFLRSAYKDHDSWYLGGSSVRHGEVVSNSMEIYHFKEATGRIEKKSLGIPGEIYDILPWKDEIMQPIAQKHFSEL